jgi:hypothetical protein
VLSVVLGFLKESVKLSMDYIKNLSRPTNLRVKKVRLQTLLIRVSFEPTLKYLFKCVVDILNLHMCGMSDVG